ncbi:MAG TPA: dTDP-4-dehydrorhamnose reductase [Bryobacteraceae bacterium]|nr:dTDP-4-dehydrorhamnose reductase [Bryobacteraceae bacterium]
MSKKVVVFGAAGQLGVELVRVLQERGYTVSPFNRASVDITNLPLLEQTLAPLDPAVVINAAAYNQVDVAEQEPQAAYAANALGVRNLALACRQMDALLVHFSTDYVFDGQLGRSYVEEDRPHPLGAYAVSKLAGELYAQAYLENPLILRTSGVFGPGGLRTARGNFVELMLRLAQSGQPIRVVEDHVASPTYAPALAERTVDLMESSHRGVFHAGGGEAISWFAFARKIFAAAQLTPELRPTNEREYRTAARRPKYSALENKRMRDCGVPAMPALEEALAAYMAARQKQL